MSHREAVIKEYKEIIHYIGVLIIGAGIIELLPLLLFLFRGWHSRDFSAFFLPGSAGIFLGYVIFKLTDDVEHLLSKRSGAMAVTITWVIAVILGALPFILGGQLSLLDAVYESMSGWTTTGLTMIDVTRTRGVYLLWRSLMQFAGGAGIAVLLLSAVIGPRASGLYEAEARNERFVPSVIDTSKIFLRLYLIYFITGIFLYVITGMSWFDAVNHAMAALSTGGFSTVPDSIGHWNSIQIEAVTIVLMLLGATNFSTHFALWHDRKIRALLDNEFILFFTLLGIAVPLLSFVLINSLYQSISSTFRISLFQAFSALSTTGFQTVSLTPWIQPAIFVMILLMIVGGNTGATAGGLKLYRFSVVLKSIYWSIQYQIYPKTAVIRHSINKQGKILLLNNDHVIEVLTYTFLYLFTYLVGVLIFLFSGFPLRESLFEFASALGTVGLSTGATGPGMPAASKVAQIFGMWLGRLEFIAIIMALIKFVKDFRNLT